MQAITNAKPIIGTVPLRKGGSVYRVPGALTTKRRQALAIKWIVAAARKVRRLYLNPRPVGRRASHRRRQSSFPAQGQADGRAPLHRSHGRVQQHGSVLIGGPHAEISPHPPARPGPLGTRQGAAVAKKLELHKMAEANRAYLSLVRR